MSKVRSTARFAARLHKELTTTAVVVVDHPVAVVRHQAVARPRVAARHRAAVHHQAAARHQVVPVAVVMTVIPPHNASKNTAIKRPIAKTVRVIIASACAVISRAVIWAAHLQAVVLHPAVQVHRLPTAALQAAPAAAANAIILQIAVPSITVILKPVGK